MDFNFGGVQTNVSGKRLAAWDIYKVKFEGCKIEQIQGKKDPTVTYNILKTRFSNENGYYEEPTFFPETEADAKRNEYKKQDGSVTLFPSHVETAEYFIAQLLNTLSPEAFNKLKEISPKLKTFEDVAKAVVKLTEKLKGTEVYIKLVGRTNNGSVNASLPNFVAVAKTPDADGKYRAYMSDRFIKLASDKETILTFNDYELKKKSEAATAKPTDMPDEVPATAPAVNTTTDDLDLDNLDI